MDKVTVLKAVADETRMRILTLLLKHNDCVRALAAELELSESTVSQHLKVLREAGLLIGEKRGYFMHYDVERAVLHELAEEIEALTAIEREACTGKASKRGRCERKECHAKNGGETAASCHGERTEKERGARYGNCKCRHS